MIIFFDFDGVLVDTFEMVLQIIQTESPTTTQEDIRWVSEGNVFARLAEREAMTGERRVENFDAQYGQLLLDHSFQEGMAEVVAELASNHTLVIVSSSNGPAIAAFLGQHHVAQYFKEVLGSDAHYSKIEKMSQSLSRYDHKAHNAICITDTLGDVHEAHALGIRPIGVTWGWHDEDRLMKGSPHAIARTPRDIITHINNLAFCETDIS